ncbi:hypothetical protein AVEN_266464-1 [Araneus ventricosus]|uniref:Uncharacterized protein n=1 Tax=Araneus ventricosus TaxID=182803 RepID=A0A4Y2E0C7_ARAVE|nr:hypothetical protein AVEN_266464-1 [Araneus ventricosus]
MVGSNQSNVFVENLRGFTGCMPKTVAGKAVIKLPLDNFHECGTTRMTNKYTARFEVARVLFCDGPRNFLPRSDDEDDTELSLPSPNIHTIPLRGLLTHEVRFNIHIHGISSVESGF